MSVLQKAFRIAIVASISVVSFFAAIKTFAETRDPIDIKTVGSLNDAREAATAKNEKRENYQRFLDLVKSENSPLLAEGNLFFAEKQYENTIESFKTALAVSPVDPRPYAMLAILYNKLGQVGEMYKILEDATSYKMNADSIFHEFFLAIAADKNVSGISLEKVRIAVFKGNKACAVTFSFDDGAQNVYTDGLPLLDRFGYKATLNINPGLIPEDAHGSTGTWAQWQDAFRRGFEIGNHALRHSALLGLSEKDLDREINDSRKLILEKTGKAPLTLVFPFGRGFFDQNGIKKALEYHPVIVDYDFLSEVYKDVFLPNFGDDYLSLKTAEQITDFAIEKKIWLIAQCHAMKTGPWPSFRPISIEFLQNYLSYLKKNEEKIWVDTISNVYGYLFERSKTKVILEETLKKGVVFRLQSDLKQNVSSAFLTVVINPEKTGLKTVSAQQNGKALAVQIQENLLLVDVMPGTSSVLVNWE